MSYPSRPLTDDRPPSRHVVRRGSTQHRIQHSEVVNVRWELHPNAIGTFSSLAKGGNPGSHDGVSAKWREGNLDEQVRRSFLMGHQQTTLEPLVLRVKAALPASHLCPASLLQCGFRLME